MRSTLRRNSSLDIIAAVKSFWMRSIKAILVCTNEGSRLSRFWIQMPDSDARCGEFLLRGIHYNTAHVFSRVGALGRSGFSLFAFEFFLIPRATPDRLKP